MDHYFLEIFPTKMVIGIMVIKTLWIVFIITFEMVSPAVLYSICFLFKAGEMLKKAAAAGGKAIKLMIHYVNSSN